MIDEIGWDRGVGEFVTVWLAGEGGGEEWTAMEMGNYLLKAGSWSRMKCKSSLMVGAW